LKECVLSTHVGSVPGKKTGRVPKFWGLHSHRAGTIPPARVSKSHRLSLQNDKPIYGLFNSFNKY
jgi:hypothetical protein